MINRIPEPIGEIFYEKSFSDFLHQPVGLEVRGIEGGFAQLQGDIYDQQ